MLEDIICEVALQPAFVCVIQRLQISNTVAPQGSWLKTTQAWASRYHLPYYSVSSTDFSLVLLLHCIPCDSFSLRYDFLLPASLGTSTPVWGTLEADK